MASAVLPHDAYNNQFRQQAPGHLYNIGANGAVAGGTVPGGQLTQSETAQQFHAGLVGSAMMKGTTTPQDQVSKYIPTVQVVPAMRSPEEHTKLVVDYISESETALIAATFPIQQVDHNTIKHSELVVDSAFVRDYAEFGVPHMMSYKNTSLTVNLGRGGLGMQMEWHLANTPEGGMILGAFYQNMAAAFVRHLHTKIVGFLSRVNNKAIGLTRRNPNAGIDKELVERAREFGIMTKMTRDNGLASAIADAAKIIELATKKSPNLSAYVLVVPEELLRVAIDSPRFNVIGPDLAGAAATAALSSLTGGMSILTCKTTLIAGVSVQPFVSNVTFGAYAVMAHVPAKSSAAGVETAARSITLQDYEGYGQPRLLRITDVMKSAFASIAKCASSSTKAAKGAFTKAFAGVVAKGFAANAACDAGEFETTYTQVVRAMGYAVGAELKTDLNAAPSLSFDTAQSHWYDWLPLAIEHFLHKRDKRDYLVYGVVRPHIKWAMAHAVMVPRGGRAGFMAMRDPNIQSASDTTQKNITWHATCYSGVICHDPQSIGHIRNLAPVSYVSGGSLTLFSGSNHQGHLLPADTYGFLVHKNDSRIHLNMPMDITGRFAGEAATVDHYHLHDVLRTAHDWGSISTSERERSAANTVVFPDNAYMSGVDGDSVNHNKHFNGSTGHWGPVAPCHNFTGAIIQKGRVDTTDMVTVSGASSAGAPPRTLW